MISHLPLVRTTSPSRLAEGAAVPSVWCVACDAWSRLSAAAMMVRQQVFALEQAWPAGELQDAQDAQALHVVLLSRVAEPVACARLAPVAFGCWMISHVAVASAHRGQGAGAVLMQVLLDRAQGMGLQSVSLHAQGHAVGFYTGLGFRAVGEPSPVRGVLHQPMVWSAQVEPMQG